MSVIPSSWTVRPLGELLIELRNGLFVSRPGVEKTERPILRISAVRPMLLRIDDVRYISSAVAVANETNFYVQKGDLLFTRYSGNSEYVGSCAMVREVLPNLLYPDKLIRGRVIPGLVSPRYVEAAMNSPQVRAETRKRLKTTAGQVGISGRDLRSIPIPLPPIREQERIVDAIEEHLPQVDAGRLALNRAQTNVARFKQTIYRPITESASKWRPLGDIAEIVGGLTKDAKRQADPSFVEVPYLRVANVQRGYLDLGNVTTIKVPKETARKLALEYNDVLFNEGGDRDKLGRGWVWEGQIVNCIHQNHVFRARIRGDFDPKFVSMHGNTFGRAWFEKMGRQTVNLASLSLTTLKAFPIPEINIDAQRRIVANIEQKLSDLALLEGAIRRSDTRANSLRIAVLEAAVSGTLVP